MGQLLAEVQLWVLGNFLGGDVFSASGKGCLEPALHHLGAGVHPILCCVLGHRFWGPGVLALRWYCYGCWVHPWRCRELSPRVLRFSGIPGVWV